MKFKYKFLLLLISLSLIGCLYVSQSYAYWMVTKEQAQANQIGSGCFSLSFSDSNNINLGNTYPVSDSVGLGSTPYKFTIKNTCTIAAGYTITLNTVSSNGIADSKIKYAIYKEGEAKPGNGQLLNSAPTNSNTTGLTTQNIAKSYNIRTGTLKGGTRTSTTQTSVTNGESATYDLYLWIDDSATIQDAAGKTFTAGIEIMSTASAS